MGQKFIPELHDPDYRHAEGHDVKPLTDDEAERRFNALIEMLDAEDQPHNHAQ